MVTDQQRELAYRKYDAAKKREVRAAIKAIAQRLPRASRQQIADELNLGGHTRANGELWGRQHVQTFMYQHMQRGHAVAVGRTFKKAAKTAPTGFRHDDHDTHVKAHSRAFGELGLFFSLVKQWAGSASAKDRLKMIHILATP